MNINGVPRNFSGNWNVCSFVMMMSSGQLVYSSTRTVYLSYLGTLACMLCFTTTLFGINQSFFSKF